MTSPERTLDEVIEKTVRFVITEGVQGYTREQTRSAIIELVRGKVPEVSTGHRPKSGPEIGWDACREQMLKALEEM